jgi:molybdate transport system permease protein
MTPARSSRGASLGRLLAWLAATALLLFIAIPIVALALRTDPLTFARSIAQPGARQALALSLVTTGFTLGIALALGTPLAYLLARTEVRWKRLLDGIVDLPIVLPPAVAGVALLVAFGRRGLLSPALDAGGIRLSFTTAAVVMAQLFVAVPFYVRAARAGFASVDRRLEEASSSLGYGALGTFTRITVPLAMPSLVGGAVLTWARALGEFGATIMFAGNLPGVSQTVPLAVYLGLEGGDLEGAIALSLLLVATSLAVLAVVRLVER